MAIGILTSPMVSGIISPLWFVALSGAITGLGLFVIVMYFAQRSS